MLPQTLDDLGHCWHRPAVKLCAGSSVWLCCSSCGFLTPCQQEEDGWEGFDPWYSTCAFSWSCPGKHSVQGLVYVLPSELSG